ncbi:hypothetical protein GCM10027515_09310 [Schumannella luteola]|uniref:Protein-L-isoaspartate carboxylmethyltransferase n=1 Tax=Schumannella luteola TaxID=472059 RepID=A0A852YHX7_9MICO|nr:hypothetical protein [Schumannella luteola]NYG97379.1 hypothetical protein [Schumannella luteola]TPX01632.1 hypothetical protein FJ656_26305 [Schumannella luteola]
MPFRTKPLLESWVEEFDGLGYGADERIRVIEQDGSEGADTGLITVSLNDASTVIYLQPVAPGDPRWVINFEGRDDTFALTPAETSRLSAELAMVSTLCAFLEAKSTAYIQAHTA